jgi:hypothetical protein
MPSADKSDSLPSQEERGYRAAENANGAASAQRKQAATVTKQHFCSDGLHNSQLVRVSELGVGLEQVLVPAATSSPTHKRAQRHRPCETGIQPCQLTSRNEM